MNDNFTKSLLPHGLRDVLPPDGEYEAAVIAGLLDWFRVYGYDRVEPPLVEFEDSLFDGAGAAMQAHTFRLMDPVSQRMMGVRADMTPQIARIATTRLGEVPRPLRLCYGGAVLRVKGTQLRPERQFDQAGVELIGSDAAGADAEVIALAAAALEAVGVDNLSIDICLPTLVPSLCRALGMTEKQYAKARSALDRRDTAEVRAIGGEGARVLEALLEASGLVDDALAKLDALALPDEAAIERDRLHQVVDILTQARPGIVLTVDPVEHRGFEYQTGLSFTLFAKGVRGELGRGGRYVIGEKQEPATGFSLYLDSVLRAVPSPVSDDRIFLPTGTDYAKADELRAEGWVTVCGLDEVKDVRAEALRQKCSHVLDGDRIIALGKD